MSGNCSNSSLNGEKVILVEDEGVQARRDYLAGCLVMRFVGDKLIRWDVFWTWMAKAWGIPSESTFSSIEDNLWLLNVSSRTVALRIMALKRWKFKDWSILMDTWTETAGRSQCLEKSNEAWVVVRGIPLHLRSIELFRKIGEFCDGFICAEDGLSLSSIRLKVKRGALIPEEAPICFGSVIFRVSIEAEAQNPLFPHGPRSTFPSWWKAKRKGIMLHNLQSEMEPLSSNLKSPSSQNGGSG
ncbi:hypothetical protein LINPERPRIM_LOCUS17024 [Linum perenne]